MLTVQLKFVIIAIDRTSEGNIFTFDLFEIPHYVTVGPPQLCKESCDASVLKINHIPGEKPCSILKGAQESFEEPVRRKSLKDRDP